MTPLAQDPRIRQTWNNISHNAETATETAAAGIWTFTHDYINPCLASISSTIDQCTGQCFPGHDERTRRLRERGRTRGRAEYNFDFYDDWDDEDEGGGGGGLLGWGNDELDRLLAGSGSHSHRDGDEQPSGRKRGMSYGTRKGGLRRKNIIDGMPDPTIIPSTNTLGFLQRLPWKIGGTLRYKPSAADLQEHPVAHRTEAGEHEEGEPLIDDDRNLEDEDREFDVTHTRARSSTTGSGVSSDSFRSRGDLFPSDGEDDAVPISDEFAMVLERRMTGNSGLDDRGSGKTRSSKGKRPSVSRGMSRTVSRTTQSSGHSKDSIGGKRGSSASMTALQGPDMVEGALLTDLHREEELVRREEDAEVQRKRLAAALLASERGLSIGDESAPEVKHEASIPTIQCDDANETPTVSVAEQITSEGSNDTSKNDFVPARLPNF